MIDGIISALKEHHIDVYRINKKMTESVELFFIKKHLDMRRGTKVTEYEVTVYRDFESEGESYRGSATVLISAGMEAGEVAEKLKGAYYAASFGGCIPELIGNLCDSSGSADSQFRGCGCLLQ